MTAPAPPALLLPAIVVGRFGEHQLRTGWHERQTDGRNGIPFVATTAEAELLLQPAPGARTLQLLLSGPVGLAGNPLEGNLSIAGNDHPLRLTVDTWVWRSVALPPDPDDQHWKIRLRMPRPVVPDTILHNGDGRRLGWYLSAIWQE